MSYELYLPQAPDRCNPVTGRFMKGHIPFTKGKKWSDFMPKRSQKRSMKGWKNLHKYRCCGHPNAGRPKKQVVGIYPDGSWKVFPYTVAAAASVNGSRHNIARCCRLNASDKTNTDHKYMGVKWYYENNLQLWKTKIIQP